MYDCILAGPILIWGTDTSHVQPHVMHKYKEPQNSVIDSYQLSCCQFALAEQEWRNKQNGKRKKRGRTADHSFLRRWFGIHPRLSVFPTSSFWDGRGRVGLWRRMLTYWLHFGQWNGQLGGSIGYKYIFQSIIDPVMEHGWCGWGYWVIVMQNFTFQSRRMQCPCGKELSCSIHGVQIQFPTTAPRPTNKKHPHSRK